MIDKSKIIKDAQKFVAKGQWDKAILEYEKILKETPHDANIHNTIGDLYLKRNDKSNSIEAFKKAAEILNRDGFTLKAIALYKKVLNINPDRVDIMMLMGKLNAERGMLGSANEYYLAAAAYFSRQNQKGRAIDIYKTLCDLNPDNLSLAHKLAELYMNEGFEREGITKIIELAEKKILSGENLEAKDLLKRIAPKASNRFEFIRVSALLDLRENRLPEATRKLVDVHSSDPTDVSVTTLLAETYQRSGRYEDAESLLKELVENDPKNESYRKQLIDVCLKSGDYASAWKEYDALIEGHLAKNEFQEAEGLIRDFLKHMPDSIEARQALTQLYTKTDQKALIPSIHMEMAKIYQKKGEGSKAVNIYRQILEQEPDNSEAKTGLAALEQSVPVPSAPAEEPPPTREVPGEMQSLSFEEKAPAAHKEKAGGLSETTAARQEEGPNKPTEGGGEFPPLELEIEAGAQEAHPEKEKVFEVPETGGESLEDFDIFKQGAGAEGPAGEEDREVRILSGGGMSDIPDLGSITGLEEEVPEAPASLDEQLTEIDVYIKYGLTPKAVEALDSLERAYPAHPEIKKKSIEICKTQGDMEGFVRLSLELMDLYVERGAVAEAADAARKALSMDPDNALLKLRLDRLSTMPGYEEAPVKAAPAPAPEPVKHEEFDSEHAPVFEDFPDAENAATMIPGSVRYYEELAEAEFYAQQGLVDEACSIYRRILVADPNNAELKAKYQSLLAAKEQGTGDIELAPEKDEIADIPPPLEEPPSYEAFIPQPEALLKKPEPMQLKEPPVAARQPSSLDDELDAAFNEMDLGGEEETPQEAPAEAHAARPEPAEETMEAEFFDLAAELKDEMGEENDIIVPVKTAEAFEDKNLEAVFKEFKKGVEDQLGREDYETHYNLGIAYKEMGMLDEALNEFALASSDPSRSLDCASMLGLCYMEKADYENAVKQFKRGLAIKGRTKEEYMGLKYDMATACELSGDIAYAHSLMGEVAGEDPNFRDVKDRLQRLAKALPEKGGRPEPAKPGPTGEPDKSAPAAKKSKVSYL